MRWSRAANAPSLMRRRRVGWPTSKQAIGLAESMSAVGEQPHRLELVGVEEVGFVDPEDDLSAAFGGFGGEQLGGLWDERGGVEAGCAAERGDDGAAASASPSTGSTRADAP
jgi:hypothetical protein